MPKNQPKKRTQADSKTTKARTKSAYDYSGYQLKYANTFVIATAILSFLLLISVFKNISHPLFWADESMTAIGSERVIQYGYPKVHDGKNVFYDLRHSNPTLGINEKNDAYVGGAGWFQYYFGVIGYKLASASENIFTKTGIYRSTFALAGTLGIFLFGFFISRLFTDKFGRHAFLSLFLFLELWSVSLALLVREVRYYSLTLLFTSIILGMYITFRFHRSFNKILFIAGLSVSLWFLFNTFAPVYFILLISIGLSELIMAISQTMKSDFRGYIRSALPVLAVLLISVAAVFPLLTYFRTFEISRAMSDFNNYNSEVYWTNVSTVFTYFKNFELLWLAIILKLLTGLEIKSLVNLKSPVFRASCFLTLVFIVFLFTIAKIPNFIYTRYIIYMQPVLASIIILDFLALLKQYSVKSSQLVSYKMMMPILIFCSAILFMVAKNFTYISGHLHELTHQYMGPLDYTIPYLQEKYPNADSLVIAANYEETSYMYYLNSKVIMGFTGNNLRQDSIIQPDVIAYRKTWGNYTNVFNTFLQAAPYEPQKFPVKDNPVNNIPELNFRPAFNHQFRTLLPADDKDATYIYLKK